MTDKTELLPCPFCRNDVIGHRVGDRSLQMSCGDCGAVGPIVDGVATERKAWAKAFEAWNKRAALSRPAPAGVVEPLEWREGEYTSTDDDNGRMEGIPRAMHAWRAMNYLIIRQRSEDGLFILRGRSHKADLIAPTLEKAKAAAQADYEARILSALSPAPADGWRDKSKISEDVLRGMIGEILVLQLDGDENSKAFSQAVEGILSLLTSPAPEAGGEVDGWRIDTSAGSDILVYKDCSVIQDEEAHWALGLIRTALRKGGA